MDASWDGGMLRTILGHCDLGTVKKSTLPEHGFVAYQIKGNEMYYNIHANISASHVH